MFKKQGLFKFHCSTSMGTLFVTADAVVVGDPLKGGTIQCRLMSCETEDGFIIHPIGLLAAYIRKELQVMAEMAHDFDTLQKGFTKPVTAC